MRLVAKLVEMMPLKILKLFILRMKVLFLSAVTIIFWRVCVSLPKIILTIIEEFIFECIMILITVGLKSAINVIGQT